MKIRFSDLWRWEGTIGRAEYAILGATVLVLKHNIDRFVAWKYYGKPWSIFSYVIPRTGGEYDRSMLIAMLLYSLPFMWCGIVLTLRRLRDAKLPPWLVIFFFAPFVNLFLFAILCVVPSKEADPAPRKSGGFRAFFDRLIPEGRLGAAALAMMLTIAFGAIAARFSVQELTSYGWGLFIGLPFILGMMSVLIYGYHRPRTLPSCLAVANLSVALMGITLLAMAFEGAICLIMAAPIGLGIASVGGLIGYSIQAREWAAWDTPPILMMLVVLLPGIMGAEKKAGMPAPELIVKSHVDIDAPPEVVWNGVVNFHELPEPTAWLFRLGIAYPIRAEIRGHGAGAVRHCTFSTEPFVEPITAWDAPHLLRFSVDQNPAPMQEWTPYKEIHPPHLHGFLVSNAGQFLLTPLPGGRTRLEGTTWYRHNLEPAGYWRWWSDYVIHTIHMRVLNHVKKLAESQARATAARRGAETQRLAERFAIR